MRCICDTGRGWGSAWRFGGVTVVIINRSQQLTTATAMSEITSDSGYGAQTPVTPVPQAATQVDALSRALPSLAKDLFPIGARVISVLSVPAKTDTSNSSDNNSASLNTTTPAHMLILMVPNAGHEVLSPALQSFGCITHGAR